MNIAVINTGGTISCAGTPLTPMSATDFATACTNIINPVIQQNYPDLSITYITDLPFPESTTGTLDSTNLQPADWCLIATYILNNYATYDGWIVLHGTDSMDFTGTALPFLLSSFNSNGIQTAVLSKPIIITGSQMPMFYKTASEQVPSSLIYNTDAFQNFCGAVAAAQSGIPEVCVYFQNNLYRGNRVLKTNASEFNAFSSPNYPALAEYGVELNIANNNVLPPPVSYEVSLDNPSVLANAIAQLAYITSHINNFPVMQFNAFPAWYSFPMIPATATTPAYPGYPLDNSPCAGLIANLLNACVGQGIKGLILESYGEGNFPSGCPDNPSNGATYQALNNANANGVVIVDCTQVISGTVNNNAYAAGAWLPAVGALSPADMTPMAAFAKLMVLLTSAGYNSWSAADVKNLLQLNLLGEIMDVSRLDSRGNAELLVNQSLTTLDGSASLINDPVLGPVLKNSTGTVLWSAIESPAPNDMPGRLIMQNDGNLVYYSRNNSAMWATNTGVSNGASSKLILGGSASNNTLSLTVYNYSANTTTATLYS